MPVNRDPDYGARYIEVVNWPEFQHYGKRDPIWIKNYLRLLGDDDYLDLSGHLRAVLHGLWLVYATKRRCVRHDTARLSRDLNLRVTTRDIEALVHAGFIMVSASKPLAEREQPASPEVEVEKEVEKPLAAVPRKEERKPRKPDPLWDAMALVMGHQPTTKSERGKWNSAVGEIREAGGSPDEIERAASVYRKRYPQTPITPKAISTNWSALLNGSGSHELTAEQRRERYLARLRQDIAEREGVA